MTPLHASGMLGDRWASHAFNAAKRGRDREGDHQQKADRHHQAERAQAIHHETAEVRTRVGFDAPDRVQCRLEFEEGARGGDDERDAAEDGGEDPCASMTGALEKTLHGARTLGADQVIELSHDLPADGLGAEHDARDSGGDEQDGRERKQRVERE